MLAIGDGYRAKRETAPIDLTRLNYYDPSDFWERIYRERGSIFTDTLNFIRQDGFQLHLLQYQWMRLGYKKLQQALADEFCIS